MSTFRLCVSPEPAVVAGIKDRTRISIREFLHGICIYPRRRKVLREDLEVLCHYDAAITRYITPRNGHAKETGEMQWEEISREADTGKTYQANYTTSSAYETRFSVSAAKAATIDKTSSLVGASDQKNGDISIQDNVLLRSHSSGQNLFMVIVRFLETFVGSMSAGVGVGFTSALLFIVIARAANVFGCGYLVNLARPAHRKIPTTNQKALWYSGLRGAMAFVLALQSVHDLPEGHGQTIFTANRAIVVLTVLLIGGSTGTMLEALEVVGDSHGTSLGDSLGVENDMINVFFTALRW